MRRIFIIIGALTIAVTAWTQLGAQQEMLPRPGPGSGVTPVAQRGDWSVAINNTPTVHVANTPSVQVRAPMFVKRGTYKITWPNGDVERVVVIATPSDSQRMADRSPEIGSDGWVEVQVDGTRRWVNIMAARAIEEAR